MEANSSDAGAAFQGEADGAVDVDACQKATSFFVLCDSFNLPLVLMSDVPGFLVGLDSEKAGIERKVVPYDFRRAAASLLSAEDVSGERIADVMGNDAKTALSVYRRRLDPIVEDAAEAMNNLFGTG